MIPLAANNQVNEHISINTLTLKYKTLRPKRVLNGMFLVTTAHVGSTGHWYTHTHSRIFFQIIFFPRHKRAADQCNEITITKCQSQSQSSRSRPIHCTLRHSAGHEWVLPSFRTVVRGQLVHLCFDLNFLQTGIELLRSWSMTRTQDVLPPSQLTLLYPRVREPEPRR